MALPLGKKSLVQIQRRGSASRRLGDLASLLEWTWRLETPRTAGLRGTPGFSVVAQAYLDPSDSLTAVTEAFEVHDRLTHCLPDVVVPTETECVAACSTLAQAISTGATEAASRGILAAEQLMNDPLDDLLMSSSTVSGATSPSPDSSSLQRIATALWRLDITAGRRAPFTKDAVGDRVDRRRLRRHRHHLHRVTFAEVNNAIASGVGTILDGEELLKQAAADLEQALEQEYAFDIHWRLAPGIVPLPSIRLEPDAHARIRLLVSVVEHCLSWIAPAIRRQNLSALLADEYGSVLESLLDDRAHLVSDLGELRWALHVHKRLARVVPGAGPVLVAEVAQAEIVLWRTAYELRRHCAMEHADALSDASGAPLRTLPARRIRRIDHAAARLAATLRRFDALAQVWHGRNPGAWPSVRDGEIHPRGDRLLARHAMAQSTRWQEISELLDSAPRLLEPAHAASNYIVEESRRSAERLLEMIEVLEAELDWVDRPAQARREALVQDESSEADAGSGRQAQAAHTEPTQEASADAMPPSQFAEQESSKTNPSERSLIRHLLGRK